MGKECNTHGEEEECMQGFGGKPRGKRPLGRPRRSWEDNIKNLEEQSGVVWTEFIWFRIGTIGGLL
jgi:hypothetical protein